MIERSQAHFPGGKYARAFQTNSKKLSSAVAVLCGSTSFRCWSGSEFTCWCRIGIKSMRILSKVLHMLKNKEKIFYFYSQQCKFTVYFLSHQWHRCMISSILYSILGKSKKSMCLEFIPTRIRIQNTEQWYRYTSVPTRTLRNERARAGKIKCICDKIIILAYRKA
jgi:hypothetical protein